MTTVVFRTLSGPNGCTPALQSEEKPPVRAAATLYTARKRLPLIYGRIAQNCEIAEVDSNPIMVASLVFQSGCRGCTTYMHNECTEIRLYPLICGQTERVIAREIHTRARVEWNGKRQRD